MIKPLYDTDKKLTFILLCLLALALLWVKKIFIEYETATFEFLRDRPEGAILRLISALQFIAIPLIYLWKFTITGFTVWVGCFTFGYRVTFSQCWSIAMAAEFIYLVPEIIKIGWFLGFGGDPSLHEVRTFYPLSIMSLVDPAAIGGRYAYPLRALNLFEVGYVYLLVDGVRLFARCSRKAVWLIISSSYLLLFLLWLCFYMLAYK